MSKLKLREEENMCELNSHIEAGQVRTDGEGFIGLVINVGDIISLSSDSESIYGIVILGNEFYEDVSFSINNASDALTASEVLNELPILLDAELHCKMSENQ